MPLFFKIRQMEYKKPYQKKCKGCNKEFTPFNALQKYCGYDCYNKNEDPKPKKRYQLPKQRKPINKVSKKQRILNSKYSVLRIEFLGKKENKKCPITGKPTTDIHHKKGRVGYADEYARLNNIPLLIDVRFWVALSRKGHQKVELNPIWAKENGYSLDRLKNENN